MYSERESTPCRSSPGPDSTHPSPAVAGLVLGVESGADGGHVPRPVNQGGRPPRNLGTASRLFAFFPITCVNIRRSVGKAYLG